VVAEVGGPVDETRVTLGFYGEDLDPDEISRELGCEPSFAHRRGDPRRDGIAIWSQGAWLLTLEGRSPSGPDELVGLLTARLPRDREVWRRLTSTHSARLSFAIFVSTWNQGFELSPTSVAAVSSMGVSVGFDIYAENGDDE
jgi:hypothetical protein